MSWRLVEGVPLPDAVGGHPALDFCNTRAGWGDPRAQGVPDRPARPRAVGARERPGPGARPPRGSGAGTRRGRGATRTRALAAPSPCARPSTRCALHRGTPADWELVSAEAAAARAASPGSCRARRRAGRLAACRPAPGPATAALAAVAAAAEDLLTSSLCGVRRRLPRRGLRLAVRRPPPQAALVLDGRMRQPGQGAPVRRAPAANGEASSASSPGSHRARDARGVTQRPPPDDDWLYPADRSVLVTPRSTGTTSPELLRVSRPRAGNSVHVRS